MSGPNYNGRQPNNTSYIKNFVYGTPPNLWRTFLYNKPDGTNTSVITTTSTKSENLYIKGNIIVDGSIISPSDINIKQNIKLIDKETTDKIMNLKPTEFSFKTDKSNHIHYGFIAQELEEELPLLVQNKPDTNQSTIKAVNYLEIIPLLVNKIQLMQVEIDELKDKLSSLSE